ncbi:hypothetical protein [Oceanirhabdus sp. W0125-5]|uniref:hypothetical protein n=1 Tax=Oceanirhabdus sp. W0125-5 TaxID=2999116 RepID=UPI0022F2E3E1|nr:hypothetical protein [Oceanirhabdus sp. W0125-5]WBW97001.1 hypothetical protein OW730_25420 [Oceanirhabdus sp. W0125-5]
MDKLWWGVLMMLFDVRVVGFDILPDIVGIILIYLALTELESCNEDFKNAKSLSLIVGIFILIRFIFRSSLLFLTIEVIVTIPMIYFILNGVSDLLLSVGCNNISEKLMNYFRIYVVLTICAIILRVLRSSVILSMTWIAITVIAILMIVTFYKAKELVK